MRCIMVMFDSLNRHFLSSYSDRNPWVKTPNFDRLAQKTIQFNTAYCGSMPCMPARRELHTGRPNFLESGWSTFQPYDDSAIEMLGNAGIHTHLSTDHYHYFEDLGAGYHTRYKTWDFARGQEGDPWIGQLGPHHEPEHINGKGRPQDWINRPHIKEYTQQPGVLTFDAGCSFIRRNVGEQNWFLQIEAFDPHEPFFFDDSFKKVYEEHYKNYDGPLFDWPGYCKVGDETPEQIEHVRHNYAALLAQCDMQLGRVLDLFDQFNLWEDTMLIVNTDHGHFLGEKDHFAKNYMPWWEEISHIPLFIYDPRNGLQGETRSSFVQTIDLAPTLLDFFGLTPTEHMLGVPLNEVMASDSGGRGSGLWGVFGGHIHVSDGRYAYYRCSPRENNDPLIQYLNCSPRLRLQLDKNQIKSIDTITDGPAHWRGMPVFAIEQKAHRAGHQSYGNLLYDLENDPLQENPIEDTELEQKMINLMIQLMQEYDCPEFQYTRMGFELPA